MLVILIDSVIAGVDIWNDESDVATRIKMDIKVKYSAHSSSQHNNERGVKIGSRMARTGKSEVMANYYFVASNGFIAGISSGTKRLLNMEKIMNGIQTYSVKILKEKGYPFVKEEKKIIATKLKKSDIVKTESEDIKFISLCSHHDSPDVGNYRINHAKVVILPKYKGYLQYTKVVTKKNCKVDGVVKKEFAARGVLINDFNNIVAAGKTVPTLLKASLKEDERKRFEVEVDVRLISYNARFDKETSIGAKLTLLKEKFEDDEDIEKDGSILEIDPDKVFKQRCHTYLQRDIIK